MSSCIKGLRIAKHSRSSHHFLNDYLGQPFFSQRMVNSQEIYFDHFHVLAANLEILGHTNDTGYNLLALNVSDQEMELLDVAWTCDGPS